MVALASVALGGALAADNFQFANDSGDAILNAAAVGFQLRFTFTTAHADAAFLAGQVAPKAGQPGQQMLKLGEFDLELAFFGAGALGENIEDQRCSIEDFAVKDSFQIAALGWRKFIVENDGIDIGAPAVLGEFVGFAFADESRGAGRGHTLQAISYDLTASSGCQFGKFLQ